MSRRTERGFTIAEVLVAVMLLGVGVIALVSSSAMVHPDDRLGQGETLAGQVANAADRDAAGFGLLHGYALHRGRVRQRRDDDHQGIREHWIVSVAGKVASVSDTVTHPVARGTHKDILTTQIEC